MLFRLGWTGLLRPQGVRGLGSCVAGRSGPWRILRGRIGAARLQPRCGLTWPQFLEKLDKNKDGVVTLDEFDDASRDYYRGLDLNRDGKIDKTDYDKLLASLAKGENVLLAVKPGGRGNISNTHVAWKATRGLPYVASPLLYDGRVYCIKNGGMISSFCAKPWNASSLQESFGVEE